MEFMLRTWRATDAATMAWYANDPDVAENLSDTFPNPYDIKDAQEFIRKCREREQSQLCRAIVISGESAGSIGVFPKSGLSRLDADLGYWLAKPYWGKGIMTAAVEQLCREAFKRFDIVRISAEVYSRNKASQRVLEKNGFKLEGILRKGVVKNGKILNNRLYGILKEDLLS